MGNKFIIFIVVIFLLFLVVFAYLFLNEQDIAVVETDLNATPTAPITSPVVETQQFSGEVIDISDTTVGYKNSILLTVETEDGGAQVFYLPEDVIVVADGETIEREDVVVGDNVQITGIPIEGGVEVTEIEISAALNVTSTTQVTATPTINPEE